MPNSSTPQARRDFRMAEGICDRPRAGAALLSGGSGNAVVVPSITRLAAVMSTGTAAYSIVRRLRRLGHRGGHRRYMIHDTGKGAEVACVSAFLTGGVRCFCGGGKVIDDRMPDLSAEKPRPLAAASQDERRRSCGTAAAAIHQLARTSSSRDRFRRHLPSSERSAEVRPENRASPVGGCVWQTVTRDWSEDHRPLRSLSTRHRLQQLRQF